MSSTREKTDGNQKSGATSAQNRKTSIAVGVLASGAEGGFGFIYVFSLSRPSEFSHITSPEAITVVD